MATSSEFIARLQAQQRLADETDNAERLRNEQMRQKRMEASASRSAARKQQLAEQAAKNEAIRARSLELSKAVDAQIRESERISREGQREANRQMAQILAKQRDIRQQQQGARLQAASPSMDQLLDAASLTPMDRQLNEAQLNMADMQQRALAQNRGIRQNLPRSVPMPGMGMPGMGMPMVPSRPALTFQPAMQFGQMPPQQMAGIQGLLPNTFGPAGYNSMSSPFMGGNMYGSGFGGGFGGFGGFRGF